LSINQHNVKPMPFISSS